MGTGSGPEGSRLTMNARRSQGCDMEDGIGGLIDGESVDRERARTLIWQNIT